MKFIKGVFLVVCYFSMVFLTNAMVIEGEVRWEASSIETYEGRKFFLFEGVSYDDQRDYLGIYSRIVKLGVNEIRSVKLLDVEYEEVDFSVKGVSGSTFIKDNIQLKYSNGYGKKVNYGTLSFVPLIYDPTSGKHQKVVKYKMEVTTGKPLEKKKVRNKSFGTSSVLAVGEWYKIAVAREGVFKLTYSFLKDLGLDVKNLDPREIKLYGNGGKMLPELNSAYRHDDLEQNSIFIEGEGDGVFDKEDYVLFYGQSPHSWSLKDSITFEHDLHKYSDSTFYYITASNTGELSKRILTQQSEASSDVVVDSYNDYWYHKLEQTNLILSGQAWFGEYFDVKKEYDFKANFLNIDLSSEASLYVSGAAKSTSNTNFSVNAEGKDLNIDFKGVPAFSYFNDHASRSSATMSFKPLDEVVDVTVSYDHPYGSIAWLEEIELNVRRHLIMSGDQLFFRDLNSVGKGVAEFRVGNAKAIERVWEVTDPINVKEQSVVKDGDVLTYTLATDSLRTFVVLSGNYSMEVYAKGVVPNQNLHAIPPIDMTILCHPLFLTQANRLADFHREEGLSVVIVTPQQVYNEFSSGSQDLVAIRDFMRMQYEKAATSEDLPKYLLLFGDGSYDNKNRLANNTNFIPTYQSLNSTLWVKSYVSDDYYGLLDPSEGLYETSEILDLGIGRFPVKNQQEADNIVNKIVNYNVSGSMSDWRNRITFIGDDEDNNTHMRDADRLSDDVEEGYPVYNRNKIFFDAYKQEASSGGNTYPEVNEAINSTFNEGALIVNYSGHGGEVGWGEERVLTLGDINGWTNTNYPLLMTATCEFSRFDDPKRTSAGELTILNETGAIALFTTVRVVLAGANFVLNTDFYDVVFEKEDGEHQRLGDIFRQVKNLNRNENSKNFTLLGDPALRLAYPKHNVVTTKLNGVDIASSDTVTISALSKVTVEGFLQDQNGQQLTDFNGFIYPTVFDKSKQINSLNNDDNGVFAFDLQTNKLFKGKTSVKNGAFSFSFIAPKDISHHQGEGKLSYYAENQQEDANGYFSGFYVGGTSTDAEVDNDGPQIKLFMNDENFVFGGITDENPVLLAFLSDTHGINMVGNGIGHDIVAILDNETENSIVLNDYYEADLNSYQKGTVKFPFKNLKEGKHTLTMKAWDVYNNSSESTIEFEVVKSQEVKLDRVYNYPNPFTTYTEFWFEHNQPNKLMYVQVQIFTVSGKLVKTLTKNILSPGFRSTDIQWDGLDHYGDPLSRGVYVYKIRVRAENFSVAEQYQKLVILR